MNLAFIQGIGPLELVIVLVIVLLIFGPKRLPALARSMGDGMREFKESVTGRTDDDDDDDAPRVSDGDRARADVHAALGRPEEAAAERSSRDGALGGEAVPDRR